MSYEFTGDSPIYQQLICLIRQRIVTGELEPGSRLPSVRELAVEYGVNPNTVQRALSELEREELLHTERTSGRFVTRQNERIEQVRKALALEQIEAFVAQMQAIGCDPDEVAAIILEKWRK